jgi:hypothetical protein
LTSADHPLADLYPRPESSAPPAVGPGYESPASRARIARWLFGGTIAANACSLLALASQLTLLNRGPGRISLDAWKASEQRVAVIAVIEIVLYLPTGIVFLYWLHRSYRNLRELHAGELRFTPGWAVGYWFVPVLNLWRPKQVLDDLWRGTAEPIAAGTSKSALIALWWGLLIGGLIVSRVAGVGDVGTLTDLKRENVLHLVAHLLELGAAVCLFRLIGVLTRRQEAGAERLSA